jgi:hypothetical protein
LDASADGIGIHVLQRGGRLGAGVQNAIGAGPNLVSYNDTTGAL